MGTKSWIDPGYIDWETIMSGYMESQLGLPSVYDSFYEPGMSWLGAKNYALAGALILGFAQNNSQIVRYVEATLHASRVRQGLPVHPRFSRPMFADALRPEGTYAMVEELLLDLKERRNAERFIFSTPRQRDTGGNNTTNWGYDLRVNHVEYVRELDTQADTQAEEPVLLLAIPVNDSSLFVHKAWDDINGGRTWHFPVTLFREPIA